MRLDDTIPPWVANYVGIPFLMQGRDRARLLGDVAPALRRAVRAYLPNLLTPDDRHAIAAEVVQQRHFSGHWRRDPGGRDSPR